MIGRKSDVFVEGESPGSAEATPGRPETASPVRRTSPTAMNRWQTQYGVRLTRQQRLDGVGRELAQFAGIGSDDDFHQAAISLFWGVPAASIEKYCA